MKSVFAILKPLVSALVGLTLGLGVTALAGENPFHVLGILLQSAFGSGYDLGMTLFYATPLIFTGLSVSFAFRVGMFNIGAEGQMLVGSFLAAAVGVLFTGVPSVLAPILACLVAVLGGAFWGAIPGWLKARRGSHEVINTIMLNFVAAGLTSWATLYVLPNIESQNPETSRVSDQYLLPHLGAFFADAPVSLALPLALVVAVSVWFFLWKTVYGFEIRAIGKNESAALTAGVESKKAQILAMAIAGGLAGLVATAEVLGNAGKFKVGFSPGYGFTGIAVALLGRNRPIGVVLAALLFGALHKGSTDLDFETEHVTRDIASVLQALVILCVSADGLWSFIKKRSRQDGMA